MPSTNVDKSKTDTITIIAICPPVIASCEATFNKNIIPPVKIDNNIIGHKDLNLFKNLSPQQYN